MIEKAFYTTGQVAKLLGVTAATVFRAVDMGMLRASTTPGGHFRIGREDLEAFLRANKVPLGSMDPKSKRVLVVEDNPAELRLFRRSLERLKGVEVKGTVSGFVAGFLTRSFKPRVIVLDIFLGHMDGRELVRLFRADPELKTTRILAVTGTADDKEAKDISACGVDGFLRKPIEPATLAAEVKKLLA